MHAATASLVTVGRTGGRSNKKPGFRGINPIRAVLSCLLPAFLHEMRSLLRGCELYSEITRHVSSVDFGAVANCTTHARRRHPRPPVRRNADVRCSI
jgi:hypothetical protein